MSRTGNLGEREEEMMKNVLTLLRSPRANGNSGVLAAAFKKGAEEAGHHVELIHVARKNIRGCLGCNGCVRNGGTCVQKDDMQEIYPKMLAADVIVLASPVYFYSWTSQMKAVLDRTFVIEKALKDTTFYLLCACAAPSEDYARIMKDSFASYVDCFRAGGNVAGDTVFAVGTMNAGQAKGSEAEEKAYKLGLSC